MAKIVAMRVEDHSKEFIDAMHDQIMLGLKAIGQEAEGYAKKECPVDSGRLRNSITCATRDFHSEGNDYDGEKASAKDKKKLATPEDTTVYIGTNVEYAPYVEFRDATHKTGKAHFLRDSVANHGDHYKEIMKAALQS